MLRTIDVEQINQIKLIPKMLRRRIENEYKNMRNNCDEFIIECTDVGDIFISFKKESNNFSFKIPSNYPFHPPKLNINGIFSTQFFDLKTNRFRKVLKYVSGLDCLCCSSYLCGNNWVPSLKMEHVIKQIEEYKIYKYLIFIKLILGNIKEKYLNRYIDLDSWLFNVCCPNACYLGEPIH